MNLCKNHDFCTEPLNVRCARSSGLALHDLQAMNTGHDGSMGTLHANNPREALSRCESMITMGGFSLPSRTIREMICASIDVIAQAARMHDGYRPVTPSPLTHVTDADPTITQYVFLNTLTDTS